jgi:hypothetical protein
MTNEPGKTLHFPEIDRSRGWKDLFVVTFLVVVLGAFVAQIASSPRVNSASPPVAAAVSATTAHG